MKLFLLFFLAVYPGIILCQDSLSVGGKNKWERLNIQPVVAMQLWSTYTFGAEVFDSEKGGYEFVDNRFNTQIRRSRLGIKGQPSDNLKFNFTTALDLVGRDVLSGTEGGSNNGGSPGFRIWNAYVQWRVKPRNEAFNVNVGYFTPQIGRESITSAFRVPSLEKAWSQNYLRRHLVGTGPGRTTGINLGGLLGDSSEAINFRYDLGVFHPFFQNYSGNSTGKKSALLYVGRLTAFWGDKESNTFSLGHKVNYFGKRNGLSIAVAGARQGATDLFASNSALSADFLLNWDNWNFDGEWSYLWREGLEETGSAEDVFRVRSNTGFVRLSYNVLLSQGYFLEPAVMVSQFNGEMNEKGQSNASRVNSFSGKDQTIDIGFNVYFNPNLKLSLHYTSRKGDAGEADVGAMINNYFFQAGAGAIHRGDWLGFGLVTIF